MSVISWDLQQPTRLVFGEGQLATLPDLVGTRSALLITTPGFTRRGDTARVTALLGTRLVAVMDRCVPNPDLEALDAEAVTLRARKPDVVVALGGGSSLDTAKVLAMLLAAPAGWNLDAHFRHGTPLPTSQALPIVAIPTTAGTGAEVTPFATVWDHKAVKKLSLSRNDLFPEAALLDPALTLELPEEVTVATGLDATSQALESLWNRRANPITRAWALQSLRLALPTLPALLDAPAELPLRSRMMEASLLAGLAISHTRTALAHSMSYPITAHFDVPHGIACSFTLPAILAFNAQADDGRLRDAAAALGYRDVEELGKVLAQLLDRVGIGKRLAAYVPDLRRLEGLVDEMFTPGRADNLMRAATLQDVREILDQTIQALSA